MRADRTRFCPEIPQERFDFGPVTRPEREKVGDVEKGDLIYLLPIVALIILLGVLPNLVLSKTEPAVKSVVERYTETKKVSVENHR